MEKVKKYLLIFLSVFAIIQILLTVSDTLYSDEGTHGIIALFYKDFLLNLKNFRSVNDILEFATSYAIKYPKITPTYPPLYHLMLMVVFLIKESVLLGRILNILISVATGYVIFLLCSELLKSEKLGLVSLVFFFCFSTIFNHSPLLMMDMLQILMFSVVLLYYIKLKKKGTTLMGIFILGFLLAIAFLTKFFSIFLIPLIIIDSFVKKRKLFKPVLLSIIISLIVISPYIFFYLEFNLYRFIFKVATTQFQNKWIYFNVFSNFGIFIGLFVGISTILFLWKNRKNMFILIWFFLPLFVFMFIKVCDIRYAYILMPIYASSCGFLMKRIYSIRSRGRRNLLLGIVFVLLIAQFASNVFNNYHAFVYPVDRLMKSIKEDGNVLILSENPVYSSVYIFYGRINHVKGNIIRPCVLNKNDLTQDFLEEWGVRYIVDQNNFVDDETKESLSLSLAEEKITENYQLRLFETKVDNKVDCNYICRLEGKACKDQGIAGFLTLM